MQSFSVMIVEDEPLIAMAMEAFVEDEGCKVVGPFAGVEPALQALESEPVSFALLDCNLGREASWPIADALVSRGIPFAFTSGKGASDIEPRFAGRPVFVKPVDETKLKALLRDQQAGG